MKQQLKAIIDRFESLSIRERLFMALALLGAVYFAWDNLLMKPVFTIQAARLQELKRISSDVKKLDTSILDYTQRLLAINKAQQMHSQKKQHAVEESRNRREEITVGLIRPKQMPLVLQSLLKQEKGLKLTRLESMSAESVYPPKEKNSHSNDPVARALNKQPVDYAKADATVSTIKSKEKNTIPNIYQHAIEMEFEGSYIGAMKYLKALEKLPWKFYWDHVGYEVVDHPVALVRLKIYTLSLDEGWIGV